MLLPKWSNCQTIIRTFAFIMSTSLPALELAQMLDSLVHVSRRADGNHVVNTNLLASTNRANKQHTMTSRTEDKWTVNYHNGKHALAQGNFVSISLKETIGQAVLLLQQGSNNQSLSNGADNEVCRYWLWKRSAEWGITMRTYIIDKACLKTYRINSLSWKTFKVMGPYPLPSINSSSN